MSSTHKPLRSFKFEQTQVCVFSSAMEGIKSSELCPSGDAVRRERERERAQLHTGSVRIIKTLSYLLAQTVTCNRLGTTGSPDSKSSGGLAVGQSEQRRNPLQDPSEEIWSTNDVQTSYDLIHSRLLSGFTPVLFLHAHVLPDFLNHSCVAGRDNCC